MDERLKLLGLSAGAFFFLGLGAACSGSPIKLSLATPHGVVAVEINSPTPKKNIPFLNPGDTRLIASVPISELR